MTSCWEHDIHVIVNDGTLLDVQMIAQRAIIGHHVLLHHEHHMDNHVIIGLLS